MAGCQKKIQTGTAVVECGRPAVCICRIPARYTVHGRMYETVEYRCELHVEGDSVDIRSRKT